MQPLPHGSSRFTRLTLVALALFVLLAVVAFASRSGFGGSSDARPSPAYVSWAFSIFLVVFVLAIPVAMYVFFLQGQEAAVERSRSFKRIVVQNVLTVGVFIVIAAVLVYARHLRPNFLGQRGGALDPGAKNGKKGGPKDAIEPVFQMPVLYVAIPLVLGLLVTGYVLHRRRLARRRGGRLPRDRSGLAEELAAEIGDAIDDLEAEPDARRAVIAAYARMERALGRHGLRRRPSETPYEYLARVLLDLRAPADAVRRLTDAFERAKFSHHEIDGARKREAIGALVAVRDALEAAAA
jgi:membrane protease YdiL (CAAX protease family)